PAAVHRSLDELAGERGATVFLILHAAVTTLLHRLTGAGDIAVGRRIAGRDEPALADLVGRFANTVTVRTRVRATQTFTELLDRTRETNLAASANADTPFEQVVDAVSPARAPLFGVLLSTLDTPAVVNLPGLAVRGLDHGISDAETDLRIDMDPRRERDGTPGELRIALAYRTDLFDEETVRAFGDRLTRILTAVAAVPRIRLGEIDITGDSEPEPSAEPADTADAAPGSEAVVLAGIAGPGSGGGPVGPAGRLPAFDAGSVFAPFTAAGGAGV